MKHIILWKDAHQFINLFVSLEIPVRVCSEGWTIDILFAKYCLRCLRCRCLRCLRFLRCLRCRRRLRCLRRIRWRMKNLNCENGFLVLLTNDLKKMKKLKVWYCENMMFLTPWSLNCERLIFWYFQVWYLFVLDLFEMQFSILRYRKPHFSFSIFKNCKQRLICCFPNRGEQVSVCNLKDEN